MLRSGAQSGLSPRASGSSERPSSDSARRALLADARGGARQLEQRRRDVDVRRHRVDARHGADRCREADEHRHVDPLLVGEVLLDTGPGARRCRSRCRRCRRSSCCRARPSRPASRRSSALRGRPRASRPSGSAIRAAGRRRRTRRSAPARAGTAACRSCRPRCSSEATAAAELENARQVARSGDRAAAARRLRSCATRRGARGDRPGCKTASSPWRAGGWPASRAG